MTNFEMKLAEERSTLIVARQSEENRRLWQNASTKMIVLRRKLKQRRDEFVEVMAEAVGFFQPVPVAVGAVNVSPRVLPERRIEMVRIWGSDVIRRPHRRRK